MRTEELSMLVNTGATLSWIPRESLERLGAIVFSRLPFELADGRRVERDVTSLLLTINGRKAPAPVAFGEPGERAVLGERAPESLGLLVDPMAEKLVPRHLRLLCAEREHGTNSALAAYIKTGTPLGSCRTCDIR